MLILKYHRCPDILYHVEAAKASSPYLLATQTINTRNKEISKTKPKFITIQNPKIQKEKSCNDRKPINVCCVHQ